MHVLFLYEGAVAGFVIAVRVIATIDRCWEIELSAELAGATVSGWVGGYERLAYSGG